jgi:hypothetical protein
VSLASGPGDAWAAFVLGLVVHRKSKIENRGELTGRLEEERSLDCVTRRAQTARKKKPGHFARDDRFICSSLGLTGSVLRGMRLESA